MVLLKTLQGSARRLCLLLLLCPLLALADADPPGRVGWLADAQGRVSWYDADAGEWAAAPRNRPLTSGDRLSTDGDARAEVRVGSTTLRLGGGSELEFERLDDARIRLRLHSGSLAVRVRSRQTAAEVDVLTAEVALHPLRSGHYRIDRIDDTTYAGAWRGELSVDDRDDPFTIDGGRRVELWREGRELRQAWTSSPDDEFADWVAREDRRDERTASYRYVSPEMTGAEALDEHGRWEQHPEFGAVWMPVAVAPGWAPYRYGRWVWMAPWGWTWVDEAPWGFAPFHYGRWMYWRERWCWSPGPYVPRPVYAPALVAWVGGSHFNISVSVGPTVGWLPLAPREAFVPYYRTSPHYRDRVNPRPPGRPYPAPVPTGPIMYGNQGVPNAVTVVPRDALQRHEPVPRAVVDLRGPVRQPLPLLREGPEPAPRPLPAVRPVPPAPPMRVQPVRPPVPVMRARPEAPAAAPQPVQPFRPPRPVVQPQPDTRPQPQPQAQPQVPQPQPQPQPRAEVQPPPRPVPPQPFTPGRPAVPHGTPPQVVAPTAPVAPVQPPPSPAPPPRPVAPVMPPQVQMHPQPVVPAAPPAAPVHQAPPRAVPQPMQPAQPVQATPPAHSPRDDGREGGGRGGARERSELR